MAIIFRPLMAAQREKVSSSMECVHVCLLGKGGGRREAEFDRIVKNLIIELWYMVWYSSEHDSRILLVVGANEDRLILIIKSVMVKHLPPIKTIHIDAHEIWLLI